MHKKLKIIRTKIKGGCQLGRKVVPHDSRSALFLHHLIFFLLELEGQMLMKYKISEHDYKILEEAVQQLQPYETKKVWNFAASFYYVTTVLTTIG